MCGLFVVDVVSSFAVDADMAFLILMCTHFYHHHQHRHYCYAAEINSFGIVFFFYTSHRTKIFVGGGCWLGLKLKIDIYVYTIYNTCIHTYISIVQ